MNFVITWQSSISMKIAAIVGVQDQKMKNVHMTCDFFVWIHQFGWNESIWNFYGVNIRVFWHSWLDLLLAQVLLLTFYTIDKLVMSHSCYKILCLKNKTSNHSILVTNIRTSFLCFQGSATMFLMHALLGHDAGGAPRFSWSRNECTKH